MHTFAKYVCIHMIIRVYPHNMGNRDHGCSNLSLVATGGVNEACYVFIEQLLCTGLLFREVARYPPAFQHMRTHLENALKTSKFHKTSNTFQKIPCSHPGAIHFFTDSIYSVPTFTIAFAPCQTPSQPSREFKNIPKKKQNIPNTSKRILKNTNFQNMPEHSKFQPYCWNYNKWFRMFVCFFNRGAILEIYPREYPSEEYPYPGEANLARSWGVESNLISWPLLIMVIFQWFNYQ